GPQEKEERKEKKLNEGTSQEKVDQHLVSLVWQWRGVNGPPFPEMDESRFDTDNPREGFALNSVLSPGLQQPEAEGPLVVKRQCCDVGKVVALFGGEAIGQQNLAVGCVVTARHRLILVGRSPFFPLFRLASFQTLLSFVCLNSVNCSRCSFSWLH